MPPLWKCSWPGWVGFEQPGLEGGVPAYSRGLELHDLKGPFQPRPFYDSIVKPHNSHLRKQVIVKKKEIKNNVVIYIFPA